MKTWRATGRLFVFIVLAGAVVAAQSRSAPPVPSGIIMGRVLDAQSEAPIGGAVVRLAGIGRGLQVRADAEGRFVFRQLPAATYTLAATTGGNGYSPSGFLVSGLGDLIAPYLDGAYGQRRPGGPAGSIVLGEGAIVADADVRLWRSAGIDGSVFDEAGEPMVDVLVSAIQRHADGRVSNGPTTRTDDRGAYHFGTLMPGHYVVVVPQTQVLLPDTVVTTDSLGVRRLAAAGAPPAGGGGRRSQESNITPGTSRDGRRYVYRSTFHPSATSVAAASVITVRAGEVRAAVDVTMTPTRASAVSGVLRDGGRPVAGFGLRLHPTDLGSGAEVMETAWTATDAQGHFTFPEVPTGSYRIEGQRRTRVPMSVSADGQVVFSEAPTPPTEQQGAWVSALVSVGETPVTDLALVVQRPLTVSGVFVMDGQSPVPGTPQEMRSLGSTLNLMPVPVTPRRRDGGDAASNSYTVRGFTTTGLMPGIHRFNVPVPQGPWSLQSITMGGRDVVDVAFALEEDVSDVVVTFTDQPAEISGTVQGDHATASVYLFPADRQRWPASGAARLVVRNVAIDRDGRFRIDRVVPGNYLVIAAVEHPMLTWPEAEWLTRASALATTVAVTPRQHSVVSLQVREVR